MDKNTTEEEEDTIPEITEPKPLSRGYVMDLIQLDERSATFQWASVNMGYTATLAKLSLDEWKELGRPSSLNVTMEARS